MFLLITIMLLGFLVGYRFRSIKVKWIEKGMTLMIWLLLFLLGIETGSNPSIINELDSIGFESIIIALGAVTGSVVGAKLLWNWIKKIEQKG